MSEKGPARTGQKLGPPGLDEVQIEMEVLSDQVPSESVEKLDEEQRNEHRHKPSAASGRGGRPPEVENLETLWRRPKAWAWWGSKYEYPMVEGDPWETLKVGVDRFDTEMCKAWNGELDTILTFTGLFSAAVVAFCAESFQSLSQSPADTTNIFLAALSQQLANSSAPLVAFSMVEGFTPATCNVYINVLYFVSLTLALSVSSACILGKQWIREYQKDISVSPCDAVRVRQARFDSLEAWKVPQIMAALPVILLAALLLFFTGLLIQLWNSSNHTAAIAVSIVVASTSLMVISTTVIPAIYSMKPRRTAFTPFRSPQSWITFVMYRRFQQWYDRIFHVYAEAPSTLANWSAFDIHFLETEAKDWFDHEISSAHRALRWVYEVLRNSSSMERAVYWCFQKQFHPRKLVEMEGHLSRYVLSGIEEDKAFDNPYRVCYDYSVRLDGSQGIDTAIGRSQAELLIRSANHAITYGVENELSNELFHCQRGPDSWDLTIFGRYSQEDMMHHQHKIQDQVALLLEQIFKIHKPSPSYNWRDIIYHLLCARRNTSSPFSREIANSIINRQLPEWIRKNRSASLLYSIGWCTYFWAHVSWEDGVALFTRLDKVMAEICSRPEGIENSHESVEKWGTLRRQFIQKMIWSSAAAPPRLRLLDGHFDALHGPLHSFSIRTRSDP